MKFVKSNNQNLKISWWILSLIFSSLNLTNINSMEKPLINGDGNKRPKIYMDIRSNPILFQMARDKNYEKLKEILSRKYNLTVTDTTGNNILHVAVISNDKNLMNFLLENPTIKTLTNELNKQNGQSPLYLSVEIQAPIDILKSLINSGADISLKNPKTNLTALDLAKQKLEKLKQSQSFYARYSGKTSPEIVRAQEIVDYLDKALKNKSLENLESFEFIK